MSGELLQLTFGTNVYVLDGPVLSAFDRSVTESLRIHVNHAAGRLEHRRNGALRVDVGWPKRWYYGMEGGPGADFLWDDLQVHPAARVEVPAEHEPMIRAFFAECAARRTLSLPGSPLP